MATYSIHQLLTMDLNFNESIKDEFIALLRSSYLELNSTLGKIRSKLVSIYKSDPLNEEVEVKL